jgi:hypothetical protein
LVISEEKVCMDYCLWITGNMDSCNAIATSSAFLEGAMTIDIYKWHFTKRCTIKAKAPHLHVDGSVVVVRIQ